MKQAGKIHPHGTGTPAQAQDSDVPAEPQEGNVAAQRQDSEALAELRDSDVPAQLRAVIGKLSRRLRRTVAGSGLTQSEISVLITVVRKGPLRLADLAEIEALNPTMLSRIAGRLAELGLIERTADPEDRRAAVVKSTAAGRRMRTRIHRERTSALAGPIAELSATQRATLKDALPVLEQLAERLGERR